MSNHHVYQVIKEIHGEIFIDDKVVNNDYPHLQHVELSSNFTTDLFPESISKIYKMNFMLEVFHVSTFYKVNPLCGTLFDTLNFCIYMYIKLNVSSYLFFGKLDRYH